MLSFVSMNKQTSILFLLFLAGIFYSCKKESFITSGNARLNITADSIKFDTVFTSTGSITRSFKIINENEQKLLLTQIKLMGGIASPFNININGVPNSEANNIEIAANDSIYLFVSVTIDPNSANLPFIISDSILIQYNGNDRYVQLEAFGKNARFLRNETITGNTTWQNDLPYVILGFLQIDTSARLTIPEGCQIFVHADAPILVDGSLQVNGIKNNEVVFSGDRLDDPYRDLPAGWPGIYFRTTSTDNQLTFAVINNATQAVVVENPSTNGNPKLQMQQCVINNAFETGLLSINSHVEMNNTLISNCGSNINIQYGGNYTFTNCTVVAYSNQYLLHNVPVVQAVNYITQNGALITNDLQAQFINCIFWGDGGAIEDEIFIAKEGNNAFNVTLNHCIYKAVNDPANTNFISVMKNMDPLFDSVDIGNKYYDFRTYLNPFAPGINSGTTTPFINDLDNMPRNGGVATDIGAYEKQ